METLATAGLPHPLAQLSRDEFTRARDIVVNLHGPEASLFFRSIYLNEPKKAELVAFLEAEHAGTLSEATQRPPRQALVEYDFITTEEHKYTRAVVDVVTGDVVSNESVGRASQPYLTVGEITQFQDACAESDLFRDAMTEVTLPEGFEVRIDPWPYGGPDAAEGTPPRYMQGLVFATDASRNNPDSNHYGYPIPIIPVMDCLVNQIIRVDRLATGGSEDGMAPAERRETPRKLFENSKPAEYVPELIDEPIRTDLKPLDIVQPEGVSFTAHPDGLIEWQKWRFRLGFTPREGAVLHDVCYDNRSILYRLSFSEMTVPYGDPRPPFHRKQAFDFGDGGMGRASNNLELGCDCLGAIHYVDSYLAAADGSPTPAKSVICLHEQDNGIIWKHTNFRTNRAVVTRMREFVVQFIVTLANYEYIFAYKLDLAGGITIETRATGVVSVVAIDDGKSSNYGTVVSPGVLAQNHQHIFAVRIDPAMDSYASVDTQIVVEESVSQSMNSRTNPNGNYYEVQRQTVNKATWMDAKPRVNRLIKLENATKKNAISGRPVGYRLVPPATQTLLADERSTVAARARFAQHHVWITGYRDGELWAAGEFTNQSREEKGGVADMVKRGDWFTDEGRVRNGVMPGDRVRADGTRQGDDARRSSPVVWSVFGLTHNPRVEDWPVMPVEINQIHLHPVDFFTANPALDVPSTKNKASVLLSCCGNTDADKKPSVQEDPASHWQGSGPDIEMQMAGANIDDGGHS
ncbi:copper amine oxidase [Ilyonectria robusta]|uniref:copper amine oxidase n=1 Tax=Ilyonectria robusta TaxID=1079257 RepID=UPI001E8EC7DC|nr:copper amine oxidase [Ilyonectria robusta]KAH8721970.1 copper amine oxidase [Ilyonectria robusta]